MIKNCSKFAITLKDPLKIRYVLEKAFFLMNKGRKGPAWIDIPLDIQGFTIPDWDKLESLIPPSENFIKPNGTHISPKSTNTLIKPYENLGQMKVIWSKTAKKASQIIGKALDLSL